MHIDELRNLVDLDRRAVAASVVALSAWDPADAALPTPCSEWTITDLVAHMTVQQHGFARAVRGEPTVTADWVPRVDPDPVAAYRSACDEVNSVFAALADPDAPVLLPEVRDQPLPTGIVVGFHLVDNVVHAWDVARALDGDLTVDDDVLAGALAVARGVPDDGRREQPGAAFRPALPVPAEPGALTEMLLLLGRDPAWTPVSSRQRARPRPPGPAAPGPARRGSARIG